MATSIGNFGSVSANGNQIAEVLDYSFDESINTVDNTLIGDEWNDHETGIKSWSGSLNCYWDTTDTLGQVVLEIGAQVTLELFPTGSAPGDVSYLGDVTIISIGRAVANNTIVTQSFGFTGKGEVSQAIALAPAPAFDAHWARVIDKSDPTLEGHLRTLFTDLQTSGVYALLDDLCVVHTSGVDSLLGLKGFVDSSTVGTPPFSPLTGFTCGTDGINNRYIDTNFLGTIPGSQMLADSVSMFCYRTSASSALAGQNGTMGVSVFNFATAESFISMFNATTMWCAMSSTSGNRLQLASATHGFAGVTRVSASQIYAVRDGATDTRTVSAGFTPHNLDTIVVGGVKSSGTYAHALGTEDMTAWGAGSGLTDVQMLSVNTAIQTYLTSRGAAA